MQPINFPGLGLRFSIQREAFFIGNLPIYWYGIIIGLAFITALMVALKEAKRIGFPQESFLDVIIVGAIVSVICARAYYVIFNWKDYQSNLMSIVMIREGGIAIYGAVIGAFFTAYLMARAKKLNVLQLFDLGGLVFPLAQAIGRWGNFVNQEAYGRETALPWRMEISIKDMGYTAVHPTFLYESLWNIVGFALIYSLRHVKKDFFLTRLIQKNGATFFAYLLWYGIGRFFVEGLRTDSLMLGVARVSQWVGLISATVALIILVKMALTIKKKV